MEMKVTHEIKARDLLSLVYILSSEALEDNGYEADELDALTFDMFTEYLESLANKKRTIQLMEG